MALAQFAESRSLTLGVELELQIVNTHDYDLVGSCLLYTSPSPRD